MSVSVRFIDDQGRETPDTPERQRTRVGIPLILDENAAAQIADLKARAEANVIVYERLAEIVAEAKVFIAAGQNVPSQPYNRDQTITLTMGWTVTYTVEEMCRGVPCRRVSMASPNPERTPSPQAMLMIMERFGFVGYLTDSYIDIEPLDDGGRAIVVTQPMSGKLSDIMSRVP